MTPPCKGMNCQKSDANPEHSLECEAQHAAAIAGGHFVKGNPMTKTIDALMDALAKIICEPGKPEYRDEGRAALAQARAEQSNQLSGNSGTLNLIARAEQAEPVAVGDERSLFTSWLLTQGWVQKPSARENGTYVNGQVQARWHAWKARADIATPPAAPVAKLEPVGWVAPWPDIVDWKAYQPGIGTPLYEAPQPANVWFFERLSPSDTLIAVEPGGARHVVKNGRLDSVAGAALLNRMIEALAGPSEAAHNAKLGAPPVGPCRVNPQYGGVSNCNFGTLGCTEAGHRAEPGGAG